MNVGKIKKSEFINGKVVYALVNLDKPGNFIFEDFESNYEVCYIGSGSIRRPDQSLYRGNSKCEHAGYIIIKINISSEEAFLLEEKYINLLGRKCDNTGILENLIPEHHIAYNKNNSLRFVDLFKEQFGTGNHISQQPGFSDEMSLHLTSVNSKKLSEGTHISQRNYVKYLEFIKAKPNDYILTNEDYSYLGKPWLKGQTMKNINSILKNNNISGVELVCLNIKPAVWKVTKTDEFNINCKFNWQ